MVRRSRCATGFIPVLDLGVWPRLLHVTLGQLVAFAAPITTFKTWAGKAFAWARVLTSALATGFHWFPLDGLFSLILFYLKFRPFKVSSSLGIGFSKANFSLCWASFLFSILVSSMMQATFTALWYISWKLVYAYAAIIYFISPFNPCSKWFILISSEATWFGANWLSSLNLHTYTN